MWHSRRGLTTKRAEPCGRIANRLNLAKGIAGPAYSSHEATNDSSPCVVIDPFLLIRPIRCATFRECKAQAASWIVVVPNALRVIARPA